MITPTSFDAARDYAELGFAVFPLHTPQADGSCSCRSSDCEKGAGKHPRTAHGLKDASRDPAQIDAWWDRWPDANVGIATGAVSGIIVVDVDGLEGEASLAALCTSHGPLPETWTATTGRGRHLLFKHPGFTVKSSTSAIGESIDIRGDGGYIVAPPSLHYSGARYVWANEAPIQPAPDWLLRLVRNPRAKNSARPAGRSTAFSIESAKSRLLRIRRVEFIELAGRIARGEPLADEGARDDTLTSATFQLVKEFPDASADDLLALMRPSIAAMPCEPEGIDEWLEIAKAKFVTARKKLGEEAAEREAAERLVRRLCRQTATSAPPGLELPAELERITVEVTTEEHVVNDAVVAALADHPHVFQHNRRLVQIVWQEQVAPDDSTRRSRALAIDPIAPPRLRQLISERVAFERSDGRGEVRAAHPPTWTVNAIAERGVFPDSVRQLNGVTDVPLIRPDGTLLCEPGYDRQTGIYFSPECEVPAIPSKPSRADAIQAARELFELVRDFPFEGARDRAVWLAGLLSVLARSAWTGPRPLYLFDANLRGSGKTKLTDVIARIAIGRDMSKGPNPPNDAEMEKQLTALGLRGAPTFSFDNIRGPFGTASLERVLTAAVSTGRILGASEQPDLRINTVWFGTANNAQVVGDMTRRVVRARLVSQDEHPERRKDFAHADLLGHVSVNRGRLLAAGLTILRAYAAWGWPGSDGLASLGFPEWTKWIRGVLIWLGEPDPGDALLSNLGQDEEVDILEQLHAGFDEVDPSGQGIDLKTAIDRGFGHTGLGLASKAPRFVAAVSVLCNLRDGARPTPHDLALKLKKFVDRPRGDPALALRNRKSHSGTLKWFLAPLGSAWKSAPRLASVVQAEGAPAANGGPTQ